MGKTNLSVELAQELNCSIISADARQFYREMSVGTAKPTVQEMRGVTHHFVNSHSVEFPLTASSFEKEFLELVINSEEQTMILTGGSGLFVKAALEGLQPIPSDENIRREIQETFNYGGLEPLLEALKKVDSTTYGRVDRENPHRVIRALEVFKVSGKSMSWWIENSKAAPRPFDARVFVLERDREELYSRINKRVLEMVDAGLEQEVKHLAPYQLLQPLKTVGYQEWWPYFKGEISREEVIHQIQQNSRRYAKRQLTWLRGQIKGEVTKINCTGESDESILKSILAMN